MPSDWKKFVQPKKDPSLPPRRSQGLFRYGPAILGLRINIAPGVGPERFVEDNPQLFATPATSRHEGYAFWALLKIIGPPGEIGKNGMVWYYQSKIGGGDVFAIVDFVVETNGPNPVIGIRVVTPYFHLEFGPHKRAEDLEQVARLIDQDMMVIDVFSQNYINDKTGRAVLRVINRAINGIEDFGPAHRRWGE